MLTPKSCDLFGIPFFQSSQLKKYQPENIPQIKTDYKENWQVWQQLIQQATTELDAPFAPPHIEHWCNGWQVRVHFFAYFKYEQYKSSATILSILLNRRRLSVSLGWYCYKTDISPITLPDYNRWLDNFGIEKYASFDIWHDAESEYDDYRTVAQQSDSDRKLRNDKDFFCTGKHIERDDLGKQDVAKWIVETVEELLPLYEVCHGK